MLAGDCPWVSRDGIFSGSQRACSFGHFRSEPRGLHESCAIHLHRNQTSSNQHFSIAFSKMGSFLLYFDRHRGSHGGPFPALGKRREQLVSFESVKQSNDEIRLRRMHLRRPDCIRILPLRSQRLWTLHRSRGECAGDGNVHVQRRWIAFPLRVAFHNPRHLVWIRFLVHRCSLVQ